MGCNYDLFLNLFHWFRMTLYKRVLVNVTKRMKKHSFCGSCYFINNSSNIYISQYTHHRFKNTEGYKKYQCWWSNMCHCFVSLFGLVQTQKINYFFVELFFLHLGTHPIKTGKELLYCHLYHKNNHFTWTFILNC